MEKKCLSCSKVFMKSKYCSKNNWAKTEYCSVKCSKAKHKIGNTIPCAYCNNLLYRKPHLIKRYDKHFCSTVCYAGYRKEVLPFYQQPSYKGVRQQGDTKQVYHKRYCKNNPENISHLKARRYAREKSASGSHTLGEWNELKAKHNHKCAYCGEEKKLTKDHIIPLSEGGKDYINNIQPLCRNCNSKKWKHIHQHPHLLTSTTNE